MYSISPPKSPSSRVTSSSHPLLRLMSLSATVPVTSYETMLLKSGHHPLGGSPVPIPSPNSSGSGHPESPKSTMTADSHSTNNNNGSPPPKEVDLEDLPLKKKIVVKEEDEADEVLSIGRDNEDEDNATNNNNADTENEEMVDVDSSETLKEKEEEEETGSQISQNSHSPSSPKRMRKYSSEDSFSIRSLCSPSSSTASSSNHTTNGHCSPGGGDPLRRANNANASLLFSIANILRPDFGTSPSPFVPQKLCVKSPPNFGELYKPYAFLGGQNPIDLSRGHGHGGVTNGGGNDKEKLRHSSASGVKRSHDYSNGNNSSSSQNSGNRQGHHGKVRPPHGHNNKVVTNSSSNNSSSNHKSEGSGSLKQPPLPLPQGKKADPSGSNGQTLWPAWVYCTRYSDRPSSGPRAKRERKAKEKEIDEKRPRTAFTAEQLARLKKEFEENRYLTEKRRQDLARELRLHENQIKIWFQNKRAKLKKATGSRGGLALQLMAQGLYNHSTIPKSGDDDDSDE